ncbi:MAG: hypothetical protein IKW50_00940 [Oscillospiraceae bacterium]|nr:hypothetical protein [Oscillospiraceae bacterium]
MNDWKQDTGSLDLEEILKEFGDGETAEAEVSEIPEPAAEAAAQAPAEAPQPEETEKDEVPAKKNTVTSDTLRLDDLAQITEAAAPAEKDVTSETIRLDAAAVTAAAGEEPAEEAAHAEEAAEKAADETEPEPISVTPPAPIVFNPKEKLRELKRKLVAGPERRYYELAEIGVGKIQMAMFLCLIVIVVCGGAALMYALDMVPENRQRLMVFGQVLAMLLGALLGSSQLVDGVTTLLKGKFTANTLLAVTFLACCADSVFCLQELRVPICAAFTLEVFMALWATYHERTTEMGMMDTMRKAIRLTSVVRCEDYFEGQSAMVRGEGQVEDFMDNYDRISGPQRVQNIYALVALLLSIVIAVAAGLLHGISMGVQIFSTTLLVAMPASFFIALSRPMAVLERRLHEVGTVLCGWKGVTGLAAKCLYPLNDHDMFPVGSVKMNGVKFYGDRDPETVIAYAAALMHANGGGLAPIFDHLLSTRNGVRFTAQNLHFYGNGGIGGEINGDPVLMGSLEFLKEMGVEIPDGTMVKQAVYVSVDGDLSGLFAITYNRVRHAAAGMATLCSSRRIRPVILAKDFLLTPAFLKDTFGLRPKRTAFPTRAECIALENKKAPEGAESLALATKDGLASVAYAITGARALFTACRLGLVVHMIGGLLGLVIMAALAVLGSTQLLTPLHILLYQLVWIIPGFIVTMWTRAI